jgi:hypothetical protein
VRRALGRLVFSILAVAAACGDGGGGPRDEGDAGPGDDDGGGVAQDAGGGEEGPISLDGPCAMGTAFGTFLVEAQDEFSLVDGAVANGVVPVSVLAEVAREGDCVLWRRDNPFCDPPCLAGDTCDHDGQCIPFPANQDVGTVTVSGLAEPVEMTPLQPGNRYSFTDLPNPAFAPGAEIRLRSTGGAVGRLALDGRGFSPVVPEGDTWLLAAGQALAVRWDAAGAAEGTRVGLRINVDQHGNTPVTLVCDAPDTGSAEIPRGLVDALLDAGISGYPNGRITRATTDRADVREGCVELRVGSPRSMDVRVDGHVPCDNAGECPDGQTCDLAENTCR